MEPVFPGINNGTTLIVAEFDEGVVLAADSRTSCNTFVANKEAEKLARITDTIFCCRSGSASQTQSLADKVSHAMYTLERTLGRTALVRDAAVEFRNQIYKGRKTSMSSIIIAGWDERYGGQVYSVPISGLMVHEPCSTGGSGSSYIQGFITDHYRRGMQRDECLKFVKKAVGLAILHDCNSGGIVRMAVISKNGVETSTARLIDPEILQVTNNIIWNLEFKGW